MKNKFIEQMQSFIAETSIGASALRNQGVEKLIQKCRDYCKKIKLATIPREPPKFASWLDRQTTALMRKAPNGAKHNFGAARKALNLFLRSASYNCCLNQAYKLDSLLPLLEVPLDSYAADHLKYHNHDLPRKWVGLKSVRKESHDKYQSAALLLAKQWKVNRVDLDVFFYREQVRAA